MNLKFLLFFRQVILILIKEVKNPTNAQGPNRPNKQTQKPNPYGPQINVYRPARFRWGRASRSRTRGRISSHQCDTRHLRFDLTTTLSKPSPQNPRSKVNHPAWLRMHRGALRRRVRRSSPSVHHASLCLNPTISVSPNRRARPPKPSFRRSP